MTGFRLSDRSRRALNGVHPDLVRVVELAIQVTPVDFVVTEGLRSRERQSLLVKQGKSRTMNSRHLTGHAVDVAALVDGRISWEFEQYRRIADAFKEAAGKLGVGIEWGGDWKRFRDGPHFQLPRSSYPDQ